LLVCPPPHHVDVGAFRSFLYFKEEAGEWLILFSCLFLVGFMHCLSFRWCGHPFKALRDLRLHRGMVSNFFIRLAFDESASCAPVFSPVISDFDGIK